MKQTVHEVAALTGVSVRTLHYYDEIGLLKPSEVAPDTGYRYYDEDALRRLQQILFYRELDFPLKEIAAILNAPAYRQEDALEKQRALLTLKRERLDRLIRLLTENLQNPKGEHTMSFQEFDTSELDTARAAYAAEAKERWGKTDAYRQSAEKTARYGKADWDNATAKMDALLEQLALHLDDAPDSGAVQQLVGGWQQFITDTYYDCTDEILAGLGQLYVSDERFTKSMDKFAPGTARLLSDGIAARFDKK